MSQSEYFLIVDEIAADSKLTQFEKKVLVREYMRKLEETD